MIMKEPDYFTGIPTYLVGPLRINGGYAKGDFEIPLATCERPLVPSVNRGCKAANACGGVETIVLKDEMTRAPVFTFDKLQTAVSLCEYVKNDFKTLAKVAESTTKYGKLTSVTPEIIGDDLYLRVGMFCGDAAGHNMTTKAAIALSKYLEAEFSGLKLVSISGNYCVDKKVSAVNSILGRGKKVVAKLKLSEETCRSILKADPADIYDIHVRKNLVGSIIAGSLCSANTQFANILSAMYLATGQDIANLVEASQGITTISLEDKSLIFLVTLPSLIVGAIGGGTSLPNQSKALENLNCKGSGDPIGFNAKKLAEIISAAVLVGELNVLAALSNSERFFHAHEALERCFFHEN